MKNTDGARSATTESAPSTPPVKGRFSDGTARRQTDTPAWLSDADARRNLYLKMAMIDGIMEGKRKGKRKVGGNYERQIKGRNQLLEI